MAKSKKFHKKKKSEKKQLPINSRIITDKLMNDHAVFLLGLFGILVAIVVVTFDLYRNYQDQKIVIDERMSVVESLSFWNKEVLDKPNYRDGHFSLAIIYYQLGDKEKAIENLDTALRIDPNFDRGIEFKNYLDNTN